jgi:hypothetical protein
MIGKTNVKKKSLIAACAVALAVGIAPALAQTPTAPATPAASPPAQLAPAIPLVLVPYEEPGSTDPHALAISEKLLADLPAAGVNVKGVAAVDHLDAVANAAKVCADNGASGILIPEGRYEQTKKIFPIGLWLMIERYPTHAEFRLDEIGCDGNIRWTTTTMGDEARTGAFSVGNLGSAVDGAFRSAIDAAVKARAAATVPQGAATPAAAAPLVAAAAAPPTTFLLLPFEQPTIGDPHAPDMSHSLLTHLQARKPDVKLGTPIDHLTAVSRAAELCTASAAQAIIVPNIRIEQSSVSGRSHASLHLTQLNCTGSVTGHGAAEADMGQAFMYNFGAAVTGVSERAMDPALDQLYPSSAPAPSPAPSPSH